MKDRHVVWGLAKEDYILEFFICLKLFILFENSNATAA